MSKGISATGDKKTEEVTEGMSISGALVVALLKESLREGKTIEIPSLGVKIGGEDELATGAEAAGSHR